LVAWTAGRGFELALINTSTANSLPGAEAAEVLGIPAIWLIHESFEPAAIWGHFDPEVRRHAEATLSEAAMAIFETDPTRALYEPLIGAERCLTLPYGLDLEPIEAERDGFDRGAARRQAGIPEDAEVVLCVGTVEPRKAQLPLALAFDLVAARNPKAHLVLVGGCGDDYSRCIEEVVEGLDSAGRISLIPITPDVQRWFGLSDLLVCASDIESLPRTVVEAMAWEMPVLATSVFGLPDLIEDGVHGWLCEERDVAALAEGLSRALGTNPDRRRRMAAAGRERVLADYRLGAYGQEVAGLIERVTGRVGAASA
jgi:glycosyltransferase involved in cell wall biosynthesis